MKINKQDIWTRINKILEQFDSIIAEIGEEMLPATNEYDQNIFETKLVIPDESFYNLQDIFETLEKLNSEIMENIVDKNNER